jgi:VanZ family protein
MKKSKSRLTAFVLWTLFILIVVGIPGSYIPKPVSFWRLLSPDKIVHIFLFGPFAFLLLRYLFSLPELHSKIKFPFLLTLFLGIIYATITELLQFFVFVGRNGNIYDAIADTVGVITGIYIYQKWNRKKDSNT